jgi:hypothetical protein
MRRKRYLIVDHSRDLDTIKPGERVPRLCVHHLLNEYHWARLDDKTVVVTAIYPIHNHDALAVHPSVTVLPSQTSSKAILEHLNKVSPPHHYSAIANHRALGIDTSHTMDDFVDALEKNFGAIFSTDR